MRADALFEGRASWRKTKSAEWAIGCWLPNWKPSTVALKVWQISSIANSRRTWMSTSTWDFEEGVMLAAIAQAHRPEGTCAVRRLHWSQVFRGRRDLARSTTISNGSSWARTSTPRLDIGGWPSQLGGFRVLVVRATRPLLTLTLSPWLDAVRLRVQGWSILLLSTW